MAHLPEALGPAIDPDTACVACNSAEQPESMLICDSCQQGFHLSCFGLSIIPEDEQWVCAGCTGLQNLEVGSSILLESPQVLYSNGSDPHLTQGLFKGSIKILGKLQQDSSGTFCQVKAEMDLAPVTESLKFYSNSTLKQLVRPPKSSLQLAEQLYELLGTELSTVILSSSRYNMFNCPAAAASLATEAWCLLADDAAATAQQVLAQPAKQGYLLQRHKKDLPSATVEPALPLHTSEELQQAHTTQSYPAPQSDGIISTQYNHPAPVMPYFYPPWMPPFGWPHGFMPSSVPAGQQQASNQYQGMLPLGWPYAPGQLQHCHMPSSVPAGQQPASNQYQGMLPLGWPYAPGQLQHCHMPSSVPAGQQPASNQYQGMLPLGWPYAPGQPQHGLVPSNVPAGQQPTSISAAFATKQKQQARTKRVKQQLLVQAAYRCDDDSKTSAQMLYKNLPPSAFFKRNAESSSERIKKGDTLITCFGAVYVIMKLCPIKQMTSRQAALLEHMICQIEYQPGARNIPPADVNHAINSEELNLEAILSNQQELWFDMYRFASECVEVRHWVDARFQQGIEQHISEIGKKCLRDGTLLPLSLAEHAVDCVVRMADAHYNEYNVSMHDSARKETERKLRIALRSDAIKLASDIASTYT